MLVSGQRLHRGPIFRERSESHRTHISDVGTAGVASLRRAPGADARPVNLSTRSMSVALVSLQQVALPIACPVDVHVRPDVGDFAAGCDSPDQGAPSPCSALYRLTRAQISTSCGSSRPMFGKQVWRRTTPSRRKPALARTCADAVLSGWHSAWRRTTPRSSASLVIAT